MDLLWWAAVLSKSHIVWSLLPPLYLNPDVWVDASTSWGIGLVVRGCWAAWNPLLGCKVANQDIGWDETIVMELMLLWMVSAGFHDTKIVVHGNNMGVLGALKKGRSKNVACNLSICQMARTMVPANILLNPMYVTFEANLADACSCGEFGSVEMCLLVLFALPAALTPFVLNV